MDTQMEQVTIDTKSIQLQSEELKAEVKRLHERLDGLGKAFVQQKQSIEATSPLLLETLNRLENLDTKVTPASLRMITPSCSESIKEITLALSKAQVQFKPVRSSGTANGKIYATFDDLFDSTKEALSVQGLKLTALLETNEFGEYMLCMKLTHASGEWFQSRALLNEDKCNARNGSLHQQIATAEQYLKRIMYRTMLCIPDKSNED